MSPSPNDASNPRADRLSRHAQPLPRVDTVIHSAARGVALAGGLVSGLLNRVLWSSRRMRPPRREVGSLISDAPEHVLLGRTRDEVFRALGPPTTATMEGTPSADADRPAFWQGSVWYYPYDAERRTAMAVRFDDGIVDHIEMIPVALGD